jgi:hypothetical protein
MELAGLKVALLTQGQLAPSRKKLGANKNIYDVQPTKQVYPLRQHIGYYA